MQHAFIIGPGAYTAFEDEAELIEKCKEWGLLSEKATKTKAFIYKGNGKYLTSNIVGFVDKMTAVIEFENKQQHCIHPSYLKEMQAWNYGVKAGALAEETAEETEASVAAPLSEEAEPVESVAEAEQAVDVPVVEEVKADASPKEKAKKGKAAKLALPEDKVKMTATVKQFTTVPNNFSDNDDEVIIYENVAILEPELEVGEAWSSHSATLKKLELEIGDTLTFECKIVAKKLTKHPVAYKINNPAKIVKQ